MAEISPELQEELARFYESLGKSREAIEEEEKARRDAIEAEKNLKAAKASAKRSLELFNSSLLNVSNNTFSKYEGAIESSTSAIKELTANFGPLGKAVGLAASALGALAGAVLKQTDSVVKGFDDLSKLGGSVGLTASGIFDLGKQAGFSSFNLGTFTKNVKDAGGNLIALGKTSSEGVKAFTKFTAVGDDQLRAYRRLGMTQDDLIESQTYYLKQQLEGGRQITKTPQELQKASLQYIDSLNVLADLTGLSVKKQQEALDIANSNEQFALYKFAQEQKILELRQQEEMAAKAGNAERLAELKAQRESVENRLKEKDAVAAVAAATMSAKDAAAVFQTLTNESGLIVTEQNAHLVRSGRMTQEMLDKLNAGQNAVGDLLGNTANATKDFVKNFGEAAYSLGDASGTMARDMGVNLEATRLAAKYTKLGTEEERKAFLQELQEKQKQLEENKKAGKEGQKAMDMAAARDSFERDYREIVDKFLNAINPLTGSSAAATTALIATGAAGTAAAAALAKIGMSTVGKGAAGGGPGIGDALKGTAGKAIKGAGIGGAAAIAGSLASDALGRETTAGKLADIAGTAAGFAGMGAMLGPYGAIAGGLLGAGYGIYQNYFNTPKMAKGGIVNPRPGGTLVTVGEAGQKEMILPLSPEMFNATGAASELAEIEEKQVTAGKEFNKELKDADQVLDKLTKNLVKYNEIVEKAVTEGDVTIDLTNVSGNVKFKSTGTAGIIPNTGTGITPGATAGTGITPGATAGAGIKVNIGEQQQKLIEALQKQGIGSKGALSNIMAQVQAESGFRSRSEEVGKYSPETLFRLYGPGSGNKVRFRSIEEAQSVVAQGPEAVGNLIYGGRMGNAPEEGFKYRGRGLIQLTGKSNYEKYGKMLGIDLVNNPDLANDPDVASKIAAAYFSEKQKQGVNLENIADIGRAVGYAGGARETAKRAQMAAAFSEKMGQAAMGGIFSGPMAGYPVELHGNELVAPLNPNSLIAQLLTSTTGEAETMLQKGSADNTTQTFIQQNESLMEMLSSKFDEMIDRLGTSVDLQDKLVKYSAT